MAKTSEKTIIGENMRRLREAINLTGPMAAERVGIDRTYWWRIEEGLAENPSFQLLERIAKIFGVRVADLLAEPKPKGKMAS